MNVNRDEVRGFFDALAGGWDASRDADAEKLRGILLFAGVKPGARVLDVACGTGVLFPFYEELGAAEVTGIDISPEMLHIARERSGGRVRLICADAAEFDEGEYDCAVVLNALPHFPDPGRLMRALAGRLAPGGRLTIAHDRGRAEINSWHRHEAGGVSAVLPPALDTAELMSAELNVDTIIDRDGLFAVSGTKPEVMQWT